MSVHKQQKLKHFFELQRKNRVQIANLLYRCIKESYKVVRFLRFPSSDGMLPVKLQPIRILKPEY